MLLVLGLGTENVPSPFLPRTDRLYTKEKFLMAINDENNISFLIKTGVQRYIMGNILDFAKSHFSEDPKKLADFVRMVKRMSYNGITIMNDVLNTMDMTKLTRSTTDELLPRVDGKSIKDSACGDKAQ